jgi:hypothetical protein
MARVHHPHIADLNMEVPDSNLENWVAAGWLKKAPSKAKTKSADATPSTNEGK